MRETEARLKELYRATRRGGWTWQAAGAALGLAAGIFAAPLGALLYAGAWALGDGTGTLSLRGAGSLLLFSTLPLLLAGAHCLDLLEKRVGRSELIKTGADDEAARKTGYAGLRTTAAEGRVLLR